MVAIFLFLFLFVSPTHTLCAWDVYHMPRYYGQNFFVDIVSNYVLKYGGAMCAYSILIPGVYLGDPRASESSVTAYYMSQTSLLISLANAVTDLNGAGNEMPRVRGAYSLATHGIIFCFFFPNFFLINVLWLLLLLVLTIRLGHSSVGIQCQNAGMS